MRKQSTRLSGALVLVVSALILASLACYSGQVPGVFEITPYYTETPLPSPETSRFEVGERTFTPREDTALFNLTVFPEPLESSGVNSKAMCLPNTTAQVLYVGLAADQKNYYLLECNGAAGWAAEDRLAGPLHFAKDDLALTLPKEGGTTVNMLDVTTFQPMFLQTCKPGSIVRILEIQAKDVDSDGVKDIFYQIECPVGNRGWVTNTDLVGPLEIDADDRALAISSEADAQGEYKLASEPAPLTEANAVEGDCQYGAVMQAQEALQVGDKVYYRMTCGDIEGWTTQEHFVGPLLYDPGMDTVIYVPAIPVFEDQLPAAEGEGEIIAVEGEETPEAEAAPTEEPLDGTALGEEVQRRVVQYIPPLYLTTQPGPAIAEGENANVVGQCVNGVVARVEEFAGLDTVYYRITCDECVEYETNADGERVCKTTETRDGWVQQLYLQGPISFVPGQRAKFADSDEVDEAGNPVALIPRVPTYIIGENTQFSGRCPLEDGVEILEVRLEKDRTRNSFSYYFKVQCQGEPASYTSVKEGDTTRYQVSWEAGSVETIEGWAAERALELIE